MLLTADWLIDGTGAAAKRAPQIRIADGRIADVTEDRGPPVTVDHAFPGCTILPGLIDTHVHLTFAALDTHPQVVQQVSTETDQVLLARAIGNAQAALRAGVTTLRDCGGRGLITLAVRDAIRQGLVVGPDLLVSGMPITTTNGHLYYLGLIADTESQVRDAAARMVAAGVDFLKIVATGGNMTPSSNRLACQYDTASLRTAVDVGRQAGMHTAAHVLAKCALPQCVEAGVRTIEHCMWRVTDDRYQFDPDLARRMVDNNQFAGLTFTAPTWRKVLPNLANLDMSLMGDLDVRFAHERRTIDAGVKFTIHTDAGVRQTPFGPSLALAVQAAVLELRLTPLEAIRAVTGTAAEAIGLTDRGILATGKRADLLVVDGDAARDPAALRRVRVVMRGGVWVR
jgi:imidazolonepropionase-like amidohydrolase